MKARLSKREQQEKWEKQLPNLNLPLRYIQIIHLGGEHGEVCVVNLITELLNPSRGSNATETIEFSTLVPRVGITKAIQNLCMIHGHGTAIEIQERMLDENGIEIPYAPAQAQLI